MQKNRERGLSRDLVVASCVAFAVVVWGALFLIAPVWQFPIEPADYRPLVPSSADPLSETPVDINTATAEQLMTLPGIGASKASAIIAYREDNGPFHSLEELEWVDGISARMVQSWYGLARTGQEQSASN